MTRKHFGYVDVSADLDMSSFFSSKMHITDMAPALGVYIWHCPQIALREGRISPAVYKKAGEHAAGSDGDRS